MNYLQLCQAVRSRIGLHGTGPSTVVAPTDVEKDIVDSVSDAWFDIQNFRPDWNWMRDRTNFSTVAGKEQYTRTDIDGPSNRIAKFIPNTLWVSENSVQSKLDYIDYDEFDYLHRNDNNQFKPYEYTVDVSDESIYMNAPDKVYSMTVDFHKTPQKLAANTDTPELPEQWHLLIVYLGIQKLSASIASASTQLEFAQAYAVMMGQLMRQQLKKKRVRQVGIA